MEIFPAIDILDNQVVRLRRGKYDEVTVYNQSALEQAQQFAAQGARWLHVVDLEGARSGMPTQLATIATLVQETGLKVEVGGGIRTLEHIAALEKAGVSRVVLGTRLVRDPVFAKTAIGHFGELICAGIDALEGEVAVEGWQEGSGKGAEELIAQLKSWGLRHLVYTDISRDGMQTGVDSAAYRHLAHVAGFALTASGGVSSLEDLSALAALGGEVIEAVIIGRALYEQAFTLSEALAAVVLPEGSREENEALREGAREANEAPLGATSNSPAATAVNAPAATAGAPAPTTANAPAATTASTPVGDASC